MKHLTCILSRPVEASVTLWGMSKHLAVLILTLTSHCWKSLRAALNLCSSRRSLFWHSLDARRLRLKERERDGWIDGEIEGESQGCHNIPNNNEQKGK